jgi:hypothetical protein
MGVRFCLQSAVARALLFTVSYCAIFRTYAEEENCEAIFRRSGSEFIILRITNTENCTFFGQKMTVILHTNMVALEIFFFQKETKKYYFTTLIQLPMAGLKI